MHTGCFVQCFRRNKFFPIQSPRRYPAYQIKGHKRQYSHYLNKKVRYEYKCNNNCEWLNRININSTHTIYSYNTTTTNLNYQHSPSPCAPSPKSLTKSQKRPTTTWWEENDALLRRRKKPSTPLWIDRISCDVFPISSGLLRPCWAWIWNVPFAGWIVDTDRFGRQNNSIIGRWSIGKSRQ